MMRFILFSAIFLMGLLATPLLADSGDEIDLSVLEKQLTTDGLIGWIHGANESTGLTVFTWRDPKNFFRFIHFPITSRDPEVQKQFKTLDRHDRVQLIGRFLDNEAPRKHISVSSLKLLSKDSTEPIHSDQVAFPVELYRKNEVTALVHIVDEGGKLLVIEYKDAIIPVFVDDEALTKLTKDLYRNDKIKIRYTIRAHPKAPTHLELDASAPEPLTVVDRIADQHGKPATLEGVLVRFPKSEQVLFDVYALQVTDKDGLKMNYTLVNFEDPLIFQAIRTKLGSFWFSSNKDSIANGRNKWVNPKIKITATGTLNVQDPGQANPQILLKSTDSIHGSRLSCEWVAL